MNTKEIRDIWKGCLPEDYPHGEAESTAPLKCPSCGAMALDLWMISGLTYYKCSHCGKKV